MELTYLLGTALGAVNGFAAALLCQGGLSGAGRFLSAGRHGVVLLLPVALGAAVGGYAVWLFGGVNRDFAGLVLTAGCLLSASITDLKQRTVSVAGTAWYAAVLAVYQLAGGSLPLAVNALLGAAAGAAALGLPHLLRPASVGLGDVVLLCVVGLGVGFPGVIFVLARAMAALCLVAVLQLVRKKADLHAQLPLAPFLLFGVLI